MYCDELCELRLQPVLILSAVDPTDDEFSSEHMQSEATPAVTDEPISFASGSEEENCDVDVMSKSMSMERTWR